VQFDNSAGPGNVICNGSNTFAGKNTLSGSTLTINSSATLTISAGGGTLGTNRFGAISLLGTARIDLTDHDLIVDYTGATPAANIRALLISGRNSGTWDGPGINTSRSAGGHSLGYAESSQLGLSTFSGQFVDNTTVLIRYTNSGDANLDGVVNALDFNALASNYGGAGKVWTQGDFNYDGSVNTMDFTALASNFGKSLAAPALGTLAPEPSSMIGVAWIGLSVTLVRRRRRLAS